MRVNHPRGQAVDTADYYECIDSTFETIETRLESLEDDIDVDTAQGVINVRFTNGVVFVFSRQPPTQQLWLATPGGGFHFVWDDDSQSWRDTKTQESFWPKLQAELSAHAGCSLEP